MIYITEVHMVDQGTAHEHIDKLRWVNTATSETGESTRTQMVNWIKNENGKIHVRDSNNNDVRVHVVDATPPYIQTDADGVRTDNLLALPRY